MTDAERKKTIKGLGFNLDYPFNSPPSDDPSAIPKQISSIWVGDRIIGDTIKDNLLVNAENVQGKVDGNSGFKFNLFLSKASPEAYVQNVSKLHSRAPAVTIIPFEEHPYFERFRTSKYYSHYLAALSNNNGKGSNFAFASDILRYRLLSHEGGIYMDVDDRLVYTPAKYDVRNIEEGSAS